MNARSAALGAVLLVCLCVSIGCVVFVFSGGGFNALIASILAMANTVAIVCVALMCFSNANDLRTMRQSVRADFSGLDRRVREEVGRRDTLSLELNELRDSSNRNTQTISAGFAELRGSYANLTEQLRTTVSTVSNFQSARVFAAQQGFSRAPIPANQSAYEPAQNSATARSQEAHSARSENNQAEGVHLFANSMNYTAFSPHENVSAAVGIDQLVISLEPIIDLFTAKTTHYRLHLAMSTPEGEEVEQDVLLHHADRTGLRPEFDVHAAREALKLLPRLRKRDSDLNIFMGIGPSTLQSASAVQDLVASIVEYSDVSRGLVLELPHAMLAGLSDAGLEGLAELARAGVRLSLSNLSINGIDLAPLETLNVKFISLTAVAAGGVAGPSPALVAFARAARAAHIHMIVTGIVDRRIVQNLTKISRYVSGPVFAEPRRVRAGVTQELTRNASVGAAA
jgi:EAL domain-containing protein (putative c-di-GMP-specific phosphodiesterase class I)